MSVCLIKTDIISMNQWFDCRNTPSSITIDQRSIHVNIENYLISLRNYYLILLRYLMVRDLYINYNIWQPHIKQLYYCIWPIQWNSFSAWGTHKNGEVTANRIKCQCLGHFVRKESAMTTATVSFNRYTSYNTDLIWIGYSCYEYFTVCFKYRQNETAISCNWD